MHNLKRISYPRKMANPQFLKKKNGPSLINTNVIYKQLYLHVLYMNC